MSIKRKTRAGKAYAYQMLLSFEMLVAYVGSCVHCEAVFVGYNSIFCRKKKSFINSRFILKTLEM